jgi:hypothetical protein
MSTALESGISASSWMFVIRSLSAVRFRAIAAPSAGVRYDGNRLECCVPGE